MSVALLLSVSIALWSASSGVKTMFEAMNIAYDESEKRNFIVLNGTALMFTIAGIAAAIVILSVAVLVPATLAAIGLSTGFEWGMRIGSYVLLVLVLMVGLAILYRFGPSRQYAKWRWISPGAGLATVIILVVSLLFSWYAANFGNYDKTYGSLAGLIALLTWIWISVTATIVGAELNSEAERQTTRDSTVGSDAPMGQRDAVAADTLGETAGADGAKDQFHGKSDDWIRGYIAARDKYAPRRPSFGALAAALPLGLALGFMRTRRRR